MENYKMNLAKREIVVKKSFLQKAENPNSSEFKELMALLAQYDSFRIVAKTQKVAEDKETHKGLTHKKMEKIIKIMVGSDSDIMREFMSRKDAEPYPITKEWFLVLYPEWREINENYKAKQAKKKAEKEAVAQKNNVQQLKSAKTDKKAS